MYFFVIIVTFLEIIITVIKFINSFFFFKRSRWAKSTLVLVPLFGAHYTLFLGFSYHADKRMELVWLFFDQLFVSFQVIRLSLKRKEIENFLKNV